MDNWNNIIQWIIIHVSYSLAIFNHIHEWSAKIVWSVVFLAYVRFMKFDSSRWCPSSKGYPQGIFPTYTPFTTIIPSIGTSCVFTGQTCGVRSWGTGSPVVTMAFNTN
jgi:hypothetical protein